MHDSDSNEPQQPAGDEHERFMLLFLESEPELRRYVGALVPVAADVQDIVQQTALALWRRFADYDAARPFTPWACRFALNETRNWVRRHQRWEALLAHGLVEHLAARREALGPEFDARFQHLTECLERLPGAQRELVEHYYFQRAPANQVASMTGRSVEAIHKALQRIRDALRECVERAGQREAAS